MIQRIQSIYLLAQIVVLSILFFVPFTEFISVDGIHAVFSHLSIADGETVYLITFPVTAMIAVMIAISLITLFLFKKRTLQIRFCVYNIILSIGLLVLFAYYILQIKHNIEIAAISYKVWMAIPLISLFCSVQALRGIRKDEILVKSYDRLR